MLLRPLNTEITADRTAVVHDGPEIVKGERRFRLQSVVVQYRWKDEAWRMSRITLTGAVIKKDGSLGINVAHRILWSSGERPLWVRSIVAQLTPSGVPYADDSRFDVKLPADGITLEA